LYFTEILFKQFAKILASGPKNLNGFYEQTNLITHTCNFDRQTDE